MSKGGLVYNTTENGAVALGSTGDSCVDLFASIGACDTSNIPHAWIQDRELTTGIMFWVRSVRDGSGRRNEFIKFLKGLDITFIEDNLELIVNNGYWKDVFHFESNKITEFIASHIKKGTCLACKWAPRKGELARKITTACGFTNKEYRKHIKEHSKNVVEHNLCQKLDMTVNDFNWVASKASQLYRKTFIRKYPDTYKEWLTSDKTKATAGAVYPHEILKLVFGYGNYDENDVLLANKQWESLPDYIPEGKSFMPIVDVSGSMTTVSGDNKTKCIVIAVALGIYLAQRCKSNFKNRFITFSENPEFELIKEQSLVEIIRDMRKSAWGMNTDFEKAYMLILKSAINWNIKPEDMPDYLIVLSDMQFDSAVGDNKLHQSIIEKRFNEAGYNIPKIIYWNLAKPRQPGNTFQATSKHKDVALISGFSPSIMKKVLACEDINPYNIMMETIQPFIDKINMSRLPEILNLNTCII